MEVATIAIIAAIIAVIGLALIIFKFLWKNVRRGIVLVLLAIAALWLLRVLMPSGWDNITHKIQVSVGNAWR